METTSQDQSSQGIQFNPRSRIASEVEGDGYTVVGDYRSGVTSVVGAIRLTRARNGGAWERHDHGDEVLVVLSGEVSMTTRDAQGRASEHKLSQGDAIIIPRGVAHQGVLHSEEAEVFFITPSTGTQEWEEAGSES